MSIIVIDTPAFSAAYAADNAQPMVSYRNLLAEKAITDALLPAAAPRQNAVEQSTADFWTSTAAGGRAFRTVTTGASEPADIAFFDAHTLAGQTITISRWNGAAWVTVATYAVLTNDAFMLVFPRASATGWGFTVPADAQVGVAWIGPRVIIPGGVQAGYAQIQNSRTVMKLGGGTRKAHWLGQRIEGVTAQVDVDFTPQLRTFVEGELDPFRRHFENGLAFIWASCPSFFTADVGYCWAADEDRLESNIFAGGDLCSLSMRMSVYAST